MCVSMKTLKTNKSFWHQRTVFFNRCKHVFYLASEVIALAIGDSGTGAAEASASTCESISGSLVGEPNIPANGPETETDESTTDESTLIVAANIGAFKLAIAEHRTSTSIQKLIRVFFCEIH